MSSVSYYKRKDSPYYYLRIYKSKNLEPDPRKRRVSIATKIPVSRAGQKEIRQLVKRINAGFLEKELHAQLGIKLKKQLLLSEGLDEFLKTKPDLAKKTIEAYELSATHMIRCCKDKYIHNYFDKDYIALINYFNKKGFSEASKSIFTRHLSAMWNYFVNQGYCEKNIIIKIKSTKTNAEPITFKDMQHLLRYYKEKNFKQYSIVYFLLLTGFRPSTALALKWENVKFDRGIIRARNVKGKRFFVFPIHKELENLLSEMGPKRSGYIFDYKRTDSLKFFRVDTKKLFLRGVIGNKYTIYQLRNTFSSWLANKGMDIGVLQTLLDHTDGRITKKHYTTYEMQHLKKQIEKVKFKKK